MAPDISLTSKPVSEATRRPLYHVYVSARSCSDPFRLFPTPMVEMMMLFASAERRMTSLLSSFNLVFMPLKRFTTKTIQESARKIFSGMEMTLRWPFRDHCRGGRLLGPD
ncbi:hypothetical protein EAF00_008413 [Botryotinia globosa]|nr:hypothetical protein EAF00_008413 [Botryotinia globosa]